MTESLAQQCHRATASRGAELGEKAAKRGPNLTEGKRSLGDTRQKKEDWPSSKASSLHVEGKHVSL